MVDLLGPIARWEMVRASRKPSFFFVRMVYAAIVATGFWIILERFYPSFVTNPIASMANFAESFLWALATVQITAILLLVPTYLAGAIAGDKEKKTLDFLLATSVSSRDIVLGKLIARMLTVALPIGSTMVLLSLASLFGGIASWDVFAMTLFSATTLFAWSSLAICVSVHCRTAREANAILYTLLVAGVFILPIGNAWLMRHFHSRALASSWLNNLWVSDFFSAHPYSYGYWLGKGLVEPLFWACGFHLALGGLCIGLAVLNLRPVYLRSFDQVPLRSTRTARRIARRTIPVGNNPIAWKEWHFAAKSGCSNALILGLVFSLFLLMMSWLGGMGLQLHNRDAMSQLVKVAVFTGAHAAFLLVLTRGATSVSSERAAGTWVSLLTTPLTEWEIVAGKFIGAIKPGVWLIEGGIAIQVLELVNRPDSLLYLPIRLAVLATLLGFFAALGLYHSIEAKSATAATTSAVFAAILLSGPLQLLLLILAALIGGPWSWWLMGMIPSAGLAITIWQGDFSGEAAFWMLGLSVLQIFVYGFAALGLLSYCAEKIPTRERIPQFNRQQ